MTSPNVIVIADRGELVYAEVFRQEARVRTYVTGYFAMYDRVHDDGGGAFRCYAVGQGPALAVQQMIAGERDAFPVDFAGDVHWPMIAGTAFPIKLAAKRALQQHIGRIDLDGWERINLGTHRYYALPVTQAIDKSAEVVGGDIEAVAKGRYDEDPDDFLGRFRNAKMRGDFDLRERLGLDIESEIRDPIPAGGTAVPAVIPGERMFWKEISGKRKNRFWGIRLVDRTNRPQHLHSNPGWYIAYRYGGMEWWRTPGTAGKRDEAGPFVTRREANHELLTRIRAKLRDNWHEA